MNKLVESVLKQILIGAVRGAVMIATVAIGRKVFGVKPEEDVRG